MYSSCPFFQYRWVVFWNDSNAREFGFTLRRLREEHELSQETLAYRSGVTKNQIQLLESGRASGRKGETRASNPRMTTLSGIAQALGMSVSALLAEAGL